MDNFYTQTSFKFQFLEKGGEGRCGGCRVCWAYGPRTLGAPKITTLVDFFLYIYRIINIFFYIQEHVIIILQYNEIKN